MSFIVNHFAAALLSSFIQKESDKPISENLPDADNYHCYKRGYSQQHKSILRHQQENHKINWTLLQSRVMHLSRPNFDKSKLEDSLKEKKKQKQGLQTGASATESMESESVLAAEDGPKTSSTSPSTNAVEPVKKSLWIRFIAEVKHYYHGFRLLGLNTKIASRTLWKILRGKPLVRRERNQFRRAVADIFRLAPFSVFIIIPFAELALPIVLKLFPNMLPSTFESSSTREVRLKKELKVKLEMAKFLQDTVEDIAVRTKKSAKKNDAAQDFAAFFHKIRSTGEEPTNEEIIKHAKLFEDQLTLDNMTRPQLTALCRLIQVPAVGTNEVLRFLLQMKLNRLHADDQMIKDEGIDTLTTAELMAACQARGMRSLGVPRSRLKQQLEEWVDLHLNRDVPNSLLLLTRVLYLPDTVPVETRVKEAISKLPDKAAEQAEVRAAELNLERVDNVTKYKVAKLESTDIDVEQENVELDTVSQSPSSQETQETEKDDGKDKGEGPGTGAGADKEGVDETLPEGPVLKDNAKVVCDDNKITHEEIDVIEQAMNKIKKTDAVMNTDAAKSELKELQEDVQEYKDDVKSLTEELKAEEDYVEPKDTKAGKRLQKQIGKFIGQVEGILNNLEESKRQEEKKNGVTRTSVAVAELVSAVQSLTRIPESKLLNIFVSLDSNKDGKIDVDEAGQVIELLNKEDVEVTPEQLEEIVKLLHDQLVDQKETSKKDPTINLH
ncbi:unnamed protein product [Clavelina lepadiformis]|uniref:Mitochondrial proton/calcium exchanger protein n=1 Tax=Clavelina lepadiformis TaxID=159417 RepID=A0ABP0GL57_CLALP